MPYQYKYEPARVRRAKVKAHFADRPVNVKNLERARLKAARQRARAARVARKKEKA